MTKTRLTILALAAVLAVGLGTNAYAFHSGGVGECSGCHSMHSAYPAGSFLLVGKDASSACLSCHQNAADTGPSSYHVSTADSQLAIGSPFQRTPGGDFGWLKKTYTWAGRSGGTETEAGQTHGHNVVAQAGYSSAGVDTSYGYVVDPDNAAAPGGTYLAANLACVSCHDMHGQTRRNYDGSITTTGLPIRGSGSYNNSADPVDGQLAVGVYRILGGPGYDGNGANFTGVPAAVAPSTYNQTEATNQVKVAYGWITGTNQLSWSEWCGSCHGDMHYDGGSNYVHPTDFALSSTIRSNYNRYVKSGDLSGDVNGSNTFTSLVPLFYGGLTYADLKTKAGNGSPTYEGAIAGARVDCLSCHRAHASGWEFALRWNPEYEFLTDSNGNYYNGGFGGRGRTIAEVEDSYYDRPSTVFAKSQRSLCNKCHVKD